MKASKKWYSKDKRYMVDLHSVIAYVYDPEDAYAYKKPSIILYAGSFVEGLRLTGENARELFVELNRLS